MNAKVLLISGIALMLAIPQMAVAQEIPAEIPIQAFLTDNDGVPVDGTVSVKISIYSSPNSGTALFTDDLTLDADAGAFTAYITPDHAIFEENSTLYLGMAIDGGAEMLPRLQLGSVPYAAVAGTAADAITLQGHSASSFAPANHAPYTAGSGIDIDGTRISLNMSCGPQQVLQWSGTEWDCADPADYTVTQKRLSDGCSDGEYLVNIAEDGRPECRPDANTQYTAASGLDLSADNAFSIATEGITDSHISPSADIDPTKILGEAATLQGGANFTGPVTAIGNVTADSFRYRTGLTGLAFHQLPAVGFQPNGVATSTRQWHHNSGGYSFLATASTSRFMGLMAPVHLPKDINISMLTCRYYNNHASETLNFTARLIKRGINQTTTTDVVQVSGTNLAGNNTNIRLLNQTITGGETYTPTTHEYFVYVEFNPSTDNVGSAMRFYGCQLVVNASGPSYY